MEFSDQDIRDAYERLGVPMPQAEPPALEAPGDALEAPAEITAVIERAHILLEKQRPGTERMIDLRPILDSLDVPVFIHDLECAFLEVNQAACEHLGYSRYDLLQMAPAQIELRAEAAALAARIQALRECGHATFDVVHVRRDGAEVPVELHCRLTEHMGRPAVLSVVRNIARRRQEEALRLSHRLLEIANQHFQMTPLLSELVAEIRRFTGCAAAGIRILDRAGTIPFQAAEGLDSAFLANEGCLSVHRDRRTCVDVVQGAIPSDRPGFTPGGSFLAGDTVQMLAASPESVRSSTRGLCTQFGFRSLALVPIRRADQTLGLLYLADPQPHRIDPATVELLEQACEQMGAAIQRICIEETLRDSRERWRALIENAPSYVVILDRDGIIQYMNRTVTGVPTETYIGRSLYELLAPEDRGRVREAIAQVYDTGEAARLEYAAPLSVGLTHFDVHAGPIRRGEEVLAVLLVVSDVTEARRTEERLRKSKRELSIHSQIADVFLTAPEDETYAEVLQLILHALRSHHGFFGYIEEDGALVCPSMTREVWEQCRLEDKAFVFRPERLAGLFRRAIEQKVIQCANEGVAVPQGHIPVQRAVAVPIVHRERAVGLIALANKIDGGPYDEDDRDLLRTIAEHIAPILDARLRRDTEARARRRVEAELMSFRRRLLVEPAFAGIVGADPKMLELYEIIRELADVNAPVLIQGESGTGKELVAAAIHREGARAEKPFIPVNCSALPATLLESELFGHVRGAFSGAIRDKKGRFELANGGTIFLDEIGELSPAIQVSLLRVLQEGAFERVGGEQTVKVDVRVLSATNRNLAKLVAAGTFREDLYYRLCVVPVTLPPLRDRRADIPLLANHFLRQRRHETGDRLLALSPEALATMMAHDWPGNVRELQNALYYALVKCRGGVIEFEHLPATLKAALTPTRARALPRESRRKLTAQAVAHALEEAGGNKKEAARLLRVSRATLYRFLALEEPPGAPDAE